MFKLPCERVKVTVANFSMILRNPSIHGKTVVKNECAASDLITGEDSPTLGFGSLWCLPRETRDTDDVANGKLVLEPKAPCESPDVSGFQ